MEPDATQAAPGEDAASLEPVSSEAAYRRLAQRVHVVSGYVPQSGSMHPCVV